MADLWVQVDAGFPTSKLVDRARALGLDTDQVIGKFVRLWLAVMVSQTHGSLADRSDAWIEEAVAWRGQPGEFARLVRTWHCDEQGEIRDWFEKYGKLEKVRSEANRIKRAQRERDREAAGDGPRDERRDGPPDIHLDRTPDVQVDSSPISNLRSAVASPSKAKALQSDVVKEFTATFQFGRWESAVEGFLRSSKSPLAAKAEIELHCTGEMGYAKTDPIIVGYALNQYMAAHHDDRLNSALFAGFVRRAKGKISLDKERQYIEREQEAKAEREREEAVAADRLKLRIDRFEEDHPDRYIELEQQATKFVEAEYPTEVRGKKILIQGKLMELIREEVRRAS